MDAPLATPFIDSFIDYLISLPQKDIDNSLSASFPVRLCREKKKKGIGIIKNRPSLCFLVSTVSLPHYKK